MDSEIGPDESVSTAVVRAVSALEGRPPGSLRPLADVVDPEALDTLSGPRDDGSSRPGGRVTFVYSQCRVTVENGEYLTVHSIAGHRREDGSHADTDVR